MVPHEVCIILLRGHEYADGIWERMKCASSYSVVMDTLTGQVPHEVYIGEMKG